MQFTWVLDTYRWQRELRAEVMNTPSPCRPTVNEKNKQTQNKTPQRHKVCSIKYVTGNGLQQFHQYADLRPVNDCTLHVTWTYCTLYNESLDPFVFILFSMIFIVCVVSWENPSHGAIWTWRIILYVTMSQKKRVWGQKWDRMKFNSRFTLSRLRICRLTINRHRNGRLLSEGKKKTKHENSIFLWHVQELSNHLI